MDRDQNVPPVKSHPFRAPVESSGLPAPQLGPPVKLGFFIPALLILGICMMAELFHYVAWWLYLGLAGLFALGLLKPVPLRRQKGALAAYTALLGFMALLYVVPSNSRKVFVRDLHRIIPGMSEAQARQIMKPYMEGSGLPPDPFTSEPITAVDSPQGSIGLKSSLVFRHSDEGEYNADWGVVSLENGRVSRVEFYPD